MKEINQNVTIEDQPGLITRKRKAAERLISLVFWAFFIYIWQPLITFFAWVFGINFSYVEMFEENGVERLQGVSPFYVLVLLVFIFTLIIWAKINEWRFKNKEKRMQTTSATLESSALYFEVSEENLKRWRKQRVSYVTHDEEGKVIQVSEDSSRLEL